MTPARRIRTALAAPCRALDEARAAVETRQCEEPAPHVSGERRTA